MSVALNKGVDLLKRHVADEFRFPEWLLDLDFEHAIPRCDLDIAKECVRVLRDVERNLRLGTEWEAGLQANANSSMSDDTSETSLSLQTGEEQEDESSEKTRRLVFASARLSLGAAIEAAFAKAASAPTTQRSESNTLNARLYNDSFLAALWSSTHATYITNLQHGVEEPPAPSVFTVPNALSALDLSDLFARRTCPRQCTKEAHSLLQILLRATNPGSRGYVL